MTEHEFSQGDAGMLRAVVAASGDGLLCIDPDARITFANAAAVSLLGLPDDPISMGIDAIPVVAIRQRLEHLVAGGHVSKSPTEAILGTKTLVARFWRSRSPKLIGVSIHDDTETAGKQDRAEAVLNATTDGLIVLDPVDTITYFNPAAGRMLGLSRRDTVGVKVRLDTLLGVEEASSWAPVRCRDVMNCTKTDCPAYDSADLRCWLMSGTLCENSPEMFASKRCRCAECEVRRANADSFDPLAPDEYSQIELEHDDGRLVIQVACHSRRRPRGGLRRPRARAARHHAASTRSPR